MRRTIVGFVVDDAGDWIAELSCGHGQHVHHRPPFYDRPWVLESESRQEKVGTYLMCPRCDRCELPERAHFVKKSILWDEVTIPAAFKRPHHLGEGMWGVIRVDQGELSLTMRGEVAVNTVVGSGSSHGVPPGLDHSIDVLGPVRFSLDYFSIERGDAVASADARTSKVQERAAAESTEESGGDPACWAHLVCAVCGSIIEGKPHHHESEPELEP